MGNSLKITLFHWITGKMIKIPVSHCCSIHSKTRKMVSGMLHHLKISQINITKKTKKQKQTTYT